MTAAVIIACLVSLTLRIPSVVAVFVTGAVGLVALLYPVEQGPTARWPSRLGVFGLGAIAFLGVRAIAPVSYVTPSVTFFVANSVAAVAEEALFRRLLYSWLEPNGVALAIVVSSMAFSLIHVPSYGWGVVPLDMAAGLILGWQRWTSGSWGVPAATHLLANLIQIG